MKEFISKYSLFKPFQLLEAPTRGDLRYADGFDFNHVTFDYECIHEKATKTFALELEPGFAEYYGSQSSRIIPPAHVVDGKLDYNLLLFGRCKSCHRIQVSFMFNIYSEGKIEKLPIKVFVQKAGCIPEIKIKPDPSITKHFGREASQWYYKGINSLNEKYGIGAYAYFRRIIEKELLKIIGEIQKLPDSNSLAIQKLLDAHSKDPAIYTIYENIFEHLPNSLKSLGHNPFMLLYKEASQGLHSLTEEQCLEKANSMLSVLDFVVRKINEENSEIKEVKDAIKKLM